jgi:uncharacterized protein
VSAKPDFSAVVSVHERGSALSLAVTPRASTNRLELQQDGTLRVRITAAPVDGAANSALVKYLSNALDIPRSRLDITSGESSRNKRIVVDGVGPEDLANRLLEALAKQR